MRIFRIKDLLHQQGYDKRIKEKLDNHAVTPPSFIWEEIAQQLPPKRRRFGFYLLPLTAILAGLAVYFSMNSSKAPEVSKGPATAQTLPLPSDGKADKALFGQKGISPESATVASGDKYSASRHKHLIARQIIGGRVSRHNTSAVNANTTIGSAVPAFAAAGTNPAAPNPVEGNAASASANTATPVTAAAALRRISLMYEVENSSQPLAEAPGLLKPGKAVRPEIASHGFSFHKLSAGIVFAAGLNQKSRSLKSTDDANDIFSNKNLAASRGAGSIGISLQYHLSPSFSVSAGFSCTESHLQGTYSYKETRSDTVLNTYYPIELLKLIQQSIKNGNLTGIDTLLFPGKQVITTYYKRTRNTSYTLRYYEIPVSARYTQSWKAFRLSLQGGISANAVMGSEFSFLTPSGDKKTISPAFLNQYGLDATAQASAGIELSPRLSFEIGPKFGYRLTPVSAVQGIDTHPKTIYVQGGLFCHI
jgi:hypothetical protein